MSAERLEAALADMRERIARDPQKAREVRKLLERYEKVWGDYESLSPALQAVGAAGGRNRGVASRVEARAVRLAKQQKDLHEQLFWIAIRNLFAPPDVLQEAEVVLMASTNPQTLRRIFLGEAQ